MTLSHFLGQPPFPASTDAPANRKAGLFPPPLHPVSAPLGSKPEGMRPVLQVSSDLHLDSALQFAKHLLSYILFHLKPLGETEKTAASLPSPRLSPEAGGFPGNYNFQIQPGTLRVARNTFSSPKNAHGQVKCCFVNFCFSYICICEEAMMDFSLWLMV